MKFYKVIKAFPGHKAGDVIELDPADAAVQTYIDQGYIAPDAAADDDVIVKAIAGIQPLLKSAADAAAAGAVEAVNKGLQLTGPRIDPGQTSEERQKSFGHFLQNVGVSAMASVGFEERAHAANVLGKLYKANYNSNFNDDYDRAQRAGGVVDAGSKGGDGGYAVGRKAALAENSGTTGGYTVPPEYSSRLLEFPPEESVILGRTDEYPLSGRELVFPVLDQTKTPTAGATSYYGGVVAGWTGEAATRTETEPTFREFRLVANELAGYALMSRNVLADNVVALEKRLTGLFRGAIGWFRDYAYIRGDGQAKPQGYQNANAALLGGGVSGNAGRKTAGSVEYDDLAWMLSVLMPGSYDRSFWVMHPTVFQKFLLMKDASSRLIFQPYQPGSTGGPAAVQPAPTILGRPYRVTEKVPTLGTAGDLSLVDPLQMYTATRQDVEIAASEHYKFLNNQMTYRFIFRGDGRSWMNAPYTLPDTTTKLSPFIILN